MSLSPTAALIIIGNEILSGRTIDKNLNFLALELGKIGVRFAEAAVVPDDEAKIIDTVNRFRKEYTYVFTTGGIGPTHDDITTSSIAKAFGVGLKEDPKAIAAMVEYYSKLDQELNDARRKMALIPENATPVGNPVSGAPGFRAENVFVMAGIPRIMQAMYHNIAPELKHGELVESREVVLKASESNIAEQLQLWQDNYSDIDIGSYPAMVNFEATVSVVLRSTNVNQLDELEQIIRSHYAKELA